MHKVLVVEDENMIRQGLIFRINWLELGCSVPLEAANGRDGLKLILSEQPDIVITDVRMPFMDGLEMLEKGLAEYLFECVIISGYDDFSYARNAIRLGVSDYLLKPVNMVELAGTIGNICKKIERNAMSRYFSGRSSHQKITYNIVDSDMIETKLKTSSRYVTILLKKIQKDYSQKLSLKHISEELDISTTYLNRKFKEEMFYTFNEFLNRYRIQKAVILLLENKYKIYEISEMTGFLEYRYFAMVFKKYVGCSPTELYDATEGREQGET